MQYKLTDAVQLKDQDAEVRHIFEFESDPEDGAVIATFSACEVGTRMAEACVAMASGDAAMVTMTSEGDALTGGMKASALIRQVLAKGHADGLTDTQLAGGIYTVLSSHGLLKDLQLVPATVGELYDWARREIGEGGDRFEFKAVRETYGRGLLLSASDGDEGRYVHVRRDRTDGEMLVPIPTDDPVPDRLDAMVREAVDRIRRARPAA